MNFIIMSFAYLPQISSLLYAGIRRAYTVTPFITHEWMRNTRGFNILTWFYDRTPIISWHPSISNYRPTIVWHPDVMKSLHNGFFRLGETLLLFGVLKFYNRCAIDYIKDSDDRVSGLHVAQFLHQSILRSATEYLAFAHMPSFKFTNFEVSNYVLAGLMSENLSVYGRYEQTEPKNYLQATAYWLNAAYKCTYNFINYSETCADYRIKFASLLALNIVQTFVGEKLYIEEDKSIFNRKGEMLVQAFVLSVSTTAGFVASNYLYGADRNSIAPIMVKNTVEHLLNQIFDSIGAKMDIKALQVVNR